MKQVLSLVNKEFPEVAVRAGRGIARTEREAFSRAGLEGIAPLETWDIEATSRQLSYASHGAFRYFGKFPPPVARYLIEQLSEPGEIVIDPMCGSGTTGVESLLLDRRAALSDVNPLAVLISKVKTQPIEVDELSEAGSRILSAYKPLSPNGAAFTPVGLRNPDHWFLPETSDSLRGLRALIELEEETVVRDALWVAFASTVRRASRATTQQGRLFLDVDSALSDVTSFFEKRIRLLADCLQWLGSVTPDVTVDCSDVRESVSTSPAQLLILHPPYFNSYRYSAVNSLELAWLGIDQRAVRGHEVREFFKVGKKENATKYVDDMVTALGQAAERVGSGGHLALMIGDTRLQGDYVRVIKPVLERISTSLILERVAVRPPRFTEASWVASQRRRTGELGPPLMDFVLTFERQ